MALTVSSRNTRRLVRFAFALQASQTVALAAATIVTGASALVAQTFVAAADLAVQVFLVVGVRTSERAADATHPVGYGRERYFWSLYAALAIFVSGFTVTIEEVLRDALHPTPVKSFPVGYAVLAANVVLDGVAFAYALRETKRRARARRRSIVQYLRRTTEPATATELIANSIAVAGGALALIALALTQALHTAVPDTVASGLIGLALIVAAIALTQQNRSLLTGRGVDDELLAAMRGVIATQPGVIDVPDLFAVVVGPVATAVDGDVIFEDELSAPDIEAAIEQAGNELRSRWPQIRYVYLTPVSERRIRGAHRVELPVAAHRHETSRPVEVQGGPGDERTEGDVVGSGADRGPSVERDLGP
jgi:cation diffusion facilitator family transporter